MTWTGARGKQLPKNWPAIRARILKRDGHRCTRLENGKRCRAQATDVHHIGDRDDHRPANLTSLCATHHSIETASEGVRARAAKYDRRRPKPPHPGLTGGG